MQMILRKVIYDTFRVDAMIINGDVSKNRMEMINGFNTGKGFDVMILSSDKLFLKTLLMG